MKTHMVLLVASLVAAAAAACGDDGPPVCPTGNCSLPGSTVVKWKFNSYPEWKFDSDGCSDVGATTVRIEVMQVEDPAITDYVDKSCGEGQATFIDLPPGTYTVN